MDKLAILERIVAEKQARKVSWTDLAGKSRKLLIDLTTASLTLSVIRGINDQNRAKLLALPWPAMCNVALKVTL